MKRHTHTPVLILRIRVAGIVGTWGQREKMGGKFHPQGLNMGKKGPNRTQEVPKEAKNSLKGPQEA